MSATFNKWYYFLNKELIKKEKPCLPGDYIHIHKWDGCYRVYEVNTVCFVVLRQHKYIQLPWSEFRCKKGDGPMAELLDIKLSMAINLHRLSELIPKIHRNKLG